MSNLKALPGRVRRVALESPSTIEPLEQRCLLSGGPVVTGVHFVGSARAVSAVVVSFNESLDPASAQDTQAYRFGRPLPHSSDSGPSLADFLPFLGRPKVRLVKQGKIQFASATYDDSTRSVTLTPYKPFNGKRFIRVLRVIASGTHYVKDAAGNPVDGNSDGTGGDDAVVRWVSKQNKRVVYHDGNGNRVTLSLKGPGTLFVFKSTTFFSGTWAFVYRPSTRTILSGSVAQGPSGNGTTTIMELEGANAIHNNLLTNSQFVVQSTDT